MNFLNLILQQRKKTVLSLAVVALITISVVGYLLLVQRPHLAELQASWLEKRRLAKAGEMRTPAAIYRDGVADLAKFRERIPLKRDYTRIVGLLMETASDNELVNTGISYKATELKGENLVAYAVSMGLEGKYAGVKSFISDIQQLPEIITIDGITLNSQDFLEESVGLQIKLTVYLKAEGV